MKTKVDITSFQKYINANGINELSRKREVLYSRYICFKFLRDQKLPFEYIGSLFNSKTTNTGLDHATILHGVRQYHKNIIYEDFKALADKIEPILDEFLVIDLSGIFEQDINVTELISLVTIEQRIFENFPILAQDFILLF